MRALPQPLDGDLAELRGWRVAVQPLPAVQHHLAGRQQVQRVLLLGLGRRLVLIIVIRCCLHTADEMGCQGPWCIACVGAGLLASSSSAAACPHAACELTWAVGVPGISVRRSLHGHVTPRRSVPRRECSQVGSPGRHSAGAGAGLAGFVLLGFFGADLGALGCAAVKGDASQVGGQDRPGQARPGQRTAGAGLAGLGSLGPSGCAALKSCISDHGRPQPGGQARAAHCRRRPGRLGDQPHGGTGGQGRLQAGGQAGAAHRRRRLGRLGLLGLLRICRRA